MKFSPNFDKKEFERGSDGAPVPVEALSIFTFLCEEVLEATRSWAGVPLKVTSGYRSPTANAAAHGQPNSEHVATVDKCAADFYPDGRPAREVFDWMRTNATLPYHQLILEHGSSGSSVIHVSVNRELPGVRSVLEGATHNAEPYISVDHVPYVAPGEQQA